MFERFTEKAINVVYESQNFAREMNANEISLEHLLLSLVKEAKGVSLKLFRLNGVSLDILKDKIIVETKITNNKIDNIPFNIEYKELLKKTLDFANNSGNENILFEHLFLLLINSKNSKIQNLLSMFNFNISSANDILTKLVYKKTKRLEHPEIEQEDVQKSSIDSIYESSQLTPILENAVAKLSTAGYEILGTEQIIASILESNIELVEILNKNGLNINNFEEKLAENESRQAEYENKKIIFTQNAFYLINSALQIAKELGSSEVKPEHLVLSILKNKKGLAYDVIKNLNINTEKLTTDILRPIEKQMSETLTILRLAKEEARRIGRNVVGTEMFLLGIIAEGTSIAANVLSNLGITMKDARNIVENLVGFGNEYFDKEIIFTNRAKKVLEKAWLSAKNSKKTKIEAVDLLLSIIEEKNSLALKALEQLGVDAIEIKYGMLINE